jgi:hypothetical protein
MSTQKLFTLCIALFLTGSVVAQTDCVAYLPAEAGTEWELTHYNKKGKETGKIVYRLTEKSVTEAGTTFSVESVAFDKKGRETFTNTFEAYCREGHFSFDMTYQLNGEMVQSYQNMEMEMDASDFVLPTMDTSAGTELADGTLTVEIGGNSPIGMNMTVTIENRTVAGQESITTPAGTFETLKVTQDVRTKMIVNILASTVEWYAEGVGMVRSETYNKNGKLQGYSELTRFEQ